MDNEVDIIIIGAGVIGLSIARSLSRKGCQTLLVEKNKNFGMGISSRNSEVIHAGLYHHPEMLKSNLCVKGKKALYEYAQKRHIPHKNCGKLVVATNSSELPKLEAIMGNAQKCGVHDLKMMTEKECKTMEPDIKAAAGLFSPSSGVIDTHSYMLSLLGDAESNGAEIAYQTEVTDIKKINNKFIITTKGADKTFFDIGCSTLINAAGLGAMKIAHMINDLNKSHIPELIMAKGSYFSYSGKTNFKHLIYPVPIIGGLGIHLTLDMAGGVKFGPDVEFIQHEEYDVMNSSKKTFLDLIKTYYPSIDETKLHPDYAGIRPKTSKKGDDFNIQFEAEHGIIGLVNLFGIESPGLTASLAIADHVTEKII